MAGRVTSHATAQQEHDSHGNRAVKRPLFAAVVSIAATRRYRGPRAAVNPIRMPG
jgi:hypothetical protein